MIDDQNNKVEICKYIYADTHIYWWQWDINYQHTSICFTLGVQWCQSQEYLSLNKLKQKPQ